MVWEGVNESMRLLLLNFSDARVPHFPMTMKTCLRIEYAGELLWLGINIKCAKQARFKCAWWRRRLLKINRRQIENEVCGAPRHVIKYRSDCHSWKDEFRKNRNTCQVVYLFFFNCNESSKISYCSHFNGKCQLVSFNTGIERCHKLWVFRWIDDSLHSCEFCYGILLEIK